MGKYRPRAELGSQMWKNVRMRVLQRDMFTCQYCQQPADTVDHIYPRSRGGATFDESNLVAACKSCNSRKSDKQGVFLAPNSTPPVFSNRPSPRTTSDVHHNPFETD